MKSTSPSYSLWQNLQSEINSLYGIHYSKQLINSKIIESKTFEEALCHNLAINLSNNSVTSETLFDIFSDRFAKRKEIVKNSIADLLEIKRRDFATINYLYPFLFSKGFLAIQAYRIANSLLSIGEEFLSFFLQFQSSVIFGIDIHPMAVLKKSVVIDHGGGIVIGATSIIEENVFLFQNVTLGSTGKEPGDRHPKIKKGVVIGASSSILGNINVGEYSVIAAGSIVLNDVPPNKTVGGNPAKIIGQAKRLLVKQ